MDDLQIYEMHDLLGMIPWASKTEFEVMRNIMWASLKPYLKNKNTTPEQLLPLITDPKELEFVERKYTDEEIQNMRDKLNERKRKQKIKNLT